jgi:ABC-2 type transport system ATP-binding protein
MNAIETHELTRKFGPARAVDAVTIEIPEGAVFGLLGANGAGKSTLLKLLVGHLKPASGSVSVLGQPPHSPRIWDRLGYVPQARYLPQWMTARECLDFARSLRPQWDAGKAAELIRRLGFPLDGRIRDLSRGHYVRLQIALALAHNPAAIVLDEPTSGLDPVGRHELLSILIDEVGARGCAVLLSSHIVEDIERMADRVAIMDHGKVVANGTVDALKAAGASSLEQAFMAAVGRSIS